MTKCPPIHAAKALPNFGFLVSKLFEKEKCVWVLSETVDNKRSNELPKRSCTTSVWFISIAPMHATNDLRSSLSRGRRAHKIFDYEL